MRPETNKDMVKAICETYGDKKERENLFFADFIRGKGEGQIMLLHGPPGTGKTLTAGKRKSRIGYINRIATDELYKSLWQSTFGGLCSA